jgi:hypothetical protein
VLRFSYQTKKEVEQKLGLMVAAGQPNDGLRGVSLVAVNEFVAGGSAEGMVDAAVQVAQRLEDVLLLQTWRYRLRHGGSLALAGQPLGLWLVIAVIL